MKEHMEDFHYHTSLLHQSLMCIALTCLEHRTTVPHANLNICLFTIFFGFSQRFWTLSWSLVSEALKNFAKLFVYIKNTLNLFCKVIIFGYSQPKFRNTVYRNLQSQLASLFLSLSQVQSSCHRATLLWATFQPKWVLRLEVWCFRSWLISWEIGDGSWE